MDTTPEQILLTIFFLTIVMLHIVKKNSGTAILYGLQSLTVVLLLVHTFAATRDISILIIAALLLIVKVILAPSFFLRLIRKHELKFSVSTYVNLPLTLVMVTVLTAIAHSQVFGPLINHIPANQQYLSLSLAALFISLFLIVNRKGALSQIVGILSLENCIVAFALFAGLEQSPALQIGVLFDISVWIIIASVFITMIHRHFGTLDVTEMRHLKE
ncbi:MAG: hypothetical protein WCV85_01815 [Patescibacteria group bacterium]|jgi:hydrogenase-4 component E